MVIFGWKKWAIFRGGFSVLRVANGGILFQLLGGILIPIGMVVDVVL